MPTVEVYEADKKRINSIRRDTPDSDRRKESYASAIKRLLDDAKIPCVGKNPGDGS
jgi:hypothetical protein